MAKKKKVRTAATGMTRRAKLVIRAFGLSHPDGYSHTQQEFLQAYLHDKFKINIELKQLEKKIKDELKNVEKERRLEDIDRELFAPDMDPSDIKLGSPFCSSCGMFKRYRKECPWCGFHEMTV
ncbi:MAG: hypothetical protein U9R75_09815 [Candidatus Thermoplasmatota archaeon]|nr:hypothetical protein [Candidatus Thermoplasmatota archaeon]